jgi:hypothetical protein
MEHRWSPRRNVQGVVVVEMPGCKPQVVTLGNLSVGGVAVSGAGLRLPTDALVTVSFSVESARDVSHHRVLAQVVYCKEHRAGLLFVEPEHDTLNVVRDLVTRETPGRAYVHEHSRVA